MVFLDNNMRSIKQIFAIKSKQQLRTYINCLKVPQHGRVIKFIKENKFMISKNEFAKVKNIDHK